MPDAPPPTAATADADADAQTVQAPVVHDDEIEGSVILVVDDNAQNVELLQAYLEALPCTVATAYDGVEALGLLEAARDNTAESQGDAETNGLPRLPDLVILDVMMPKMSGFEVCRKMKDDPATRAIPVMMVTALNELGDIERAVESGTDDFLSKPVNKLELLTRVRSLLRVRHLKQQNDRYALYIEELEARRGDEN